MTGMILSATLYANNEHTSVSQTKNKLKELDVKISRLKNRLSNAKDKQGILTKELASTEKQISEDLRKLRQIRIDLQNKEHKIAELQHKDDQLSTELLSQQQQLAHHVKARYLMGEYQPLKWLVNQDDPYRYSRILTYYQYLIRSRQQLITTIDHTKNDLSQNREILDKELIANKNLQNQVNQHQSKLTEFKSYHTELIKSLDNQIQSNQQTLIDFQKDKDNLSRLLTSLSQQSVIQSSKPFLQMRKRLPLPVQTEHRSFKTMNQGVTFFADEGAIVTAVHPGKVVFSDWLKGYGLLLIIDHGQGFMTLYANNQSLFKRKGQMVNQNEQVASVGHSGGIKQNGLYFEIRLRGKAIPPLTWLS